jgi:hypothetical protein
VLVNLERLIFGNVCLEPDTGANGGAGDGEGAGGDGNVKTYTEAEVQEQLKQSMMRHRKGLQEELKKKDDALAQLQQQINDLQLKSADAGIDDKTLEGKLELQQKKFEREIEQLNARLVEEEKKRVAAEAKATQTRRDTLINEALVAAGCRDLKVGFRTVLPEVEYDDVEDDWLVKTPGGKLVSLKDGLKELLPDFLKVSSAQEGGSGSRSGNVKREQRLAELDRETKAMAELHKTATRTGKENDLHAYLKKKREVAALKNELQA